MTMVCGKWQQLEMQLYCKMAFSITRVDGVPYCPPAASPSDSRELLVAGAFPFGAWV